MTSFSPLRLHWWRAVPNFGDALSPLVVAHVSGRDVVNTGPAQADLFAIGSLLQVVRRASERWADGHSPWVWGTGVLHELSTLGFVDRIRISLLRGPLSARLLGLDHQRFGDAGLLTPKVIAPRPRQDRIGIVPHHSLADDPDLHAFVASDPAYLLIDPRGDVAQICGQISECAHVFSSSLHGLIVADAYHVPNIWITPKGQGTLKYHDYAASVGRKDMEYPLSLSEAAQLLPSPISYADGIAECQAALYASFPEHLKAA